MNYGVNEIFTNSFKQKELQKYNSITITNPLNTDLFHLREELFTKLLDIFNINMKLGFLNTSFFEIGRVFKNFNNSIVEQDKLSAILQLNFFKNTKDSSLNWFINKGFVEHLLFNFGYVNIISEKIDSNNEYFHPNRSLVFKTTDNKILSTFGEIHPKFEEFKTTKFPVYLLDLNLAHFKTWRIKTKISQYKEYSKYPSIVKDLSFSITKDNNFYSIKEKIQLISSYLKSIEFFDIYFESNLGKKINVGIRLNFQSNIKTLTTEIVEHEITLIRELLINEFNAEFK